MENKDLVCPICGEPTSVYMGNARKDRLCKKHGKMRNDKLIDVNDDGLFVEIATGMILNPPAEAPKKVEDTKQAKEEQPQTIFIDKSIKCITCGYESEGKLFCKKCYAKYCNKEILIKVKNCKEIVPLDDFYEGYYECDDGHVVKSMAERDIDDYLFAHNIKHGYEVPLPIIDDSGKKIILHPDFCIFNENSEPQYYIEYWGYDDSNRDYTKTKKFKMPLYRKAGITLINVNAKYDVRNLKPNLAFKIQNQIPGTINFENE